MKVQKKTFQMKNGETNFKNYKNEHREDLSPKDPL